MNRRRFLWTTGAAGIGLSSGVRAQTREAAVAANSKLRVLSIGVDGVSPRMVTFVDGVSPRIDGVSPPD